MQKNLLTFLALLIIASLSACGGGDSGDDPTPNPGEVTGGDAGVGTEPIDDDIPHGNYFGGPGAAADVSHTYSEKQMAVIEEIKEITKTHGPDYDFSEMFPVIEDDGNNYQIYFNYKSPTAIGGSPEALISKQDNTILKIRYTQ